MSGRDTYPRTILGGRTFRAAWHSPDEFVIRSKRQWATIVLMLLVLILMSGAVGLATLGIVETAVIRPNGLGMVCFAVFGSLMLLCFCLMVVVVCRVVLVRRVTLDIQEREVRVRHVPGFPNDFPFATAKSVDMLQCGDRGTSACHVCLTLSDRPGLVWIVSAAGYMSPEYNQHELLPLARLLARTLGCPLESSRQRFAMFSIAKWPESQSIPLCETEEDLDSAPHPPAKPGGVGRD
jgi:hypothetical protein